MKIFEVNPYELRDLLRKAEDDICKELGMRISREAEFKGKPQNCCCLPAVSFFLEEGITDDSEFSLKLKDMIEKAAKALAKELRHGKAEAISQLYAMPAFISEKGRFQVLMMVKFDASQEAEKDRHGTGANSDLPSAGLS